MVRIASRAGAPIPAADRHDRLRRTFPGERIQKDSPLTTRVFLRDGVRPPLVRTYQPKVQLTQRSVRPSKLRIEPEPNAPLLARIVKNPYAESTGSPRRTQVYEPVALVSVRPVPTPDPVAESRLARGPMTAGNPVKTLEIHPARLLPPPSIDAWLASREG